MKKSFLSMLIGVFMITTGGVAFAGVTGFVQYWPDYCTPEQMSVEKAFFLRNSKLGPVVSISWLEKIVTASKASAGKVAQKSFRCTVPGSVVYTYEDQM